jgi:hypothetical protein
MRSDQTSSGSNRRAFFFVQIPPAGFERLDAHTAPSQINHSFRRSATYQRLPIFVATAYSARLAVQSGSQHAPQHNFATKNTPKKQTVK